MRLASPGRPHLTYCTNIHPGESLADVRRVLVEHVAGVKARLRVVGPFGVGLRLSARAAEELDEPGALEAFAELLEAHDLYVFTINGFPYGNFHGERVKAAVYRPDWRERPRVAYADRLANLLAALTPEGSEGSVSTVPGAFRERAPGAIEAAEIARHVLDHAAELFRVRERTGKLVEVALEPEPCCFLETTRDTVSFFEDHLFSHAARVHFARATGLDEGAAESFLRRHVGVCLDACHLAVEFEAAAESVSALRRAGIRIGKIQVTDALRVEVDPARSGELMDALRSFADGVYLHQVVVQADGALIRYLDLPEALDAERRAGRPTTTEWRIHFHVPVFAEALGKFGSTQPFLRDLLSIVRREVVSEHLEVETYTWDVLPDEHRGADVDDAIARELSWTMAELGDQSLEQRAIR